MREKSCWYSLKNVNCSNGGIKYKLSAVLYIFVFNRNTILCIHVKALDSNFQLIPKMLVQILELIGQKYETQSIFLSRKKSAQILRPQEKGCNMLKYLIICYFQMGLF